MDTSKSLERTANKWKLQKIKLLLAVENESRTYNYAFLTPLPQNRKCLWALTWVTLYDPENSTPTSSVKEIRGGFLRLPMAKHGPCTATRMMLHTGLFWPQVSLMFPPSNRLVRTDSSPKLRIQVKLEGSSQNQFGGETFRAESGRRFPTKHSIRKLGVFFWLVIMFTGIRLFCCTKPMMQNSPMLGVCSPYFSKVCWNGSFQNNFISNLLILFTLTVHWLCAVKVPSRKSVKCSWNSFYRGLYKMVRMNQKRQVSSKVKTNRTGFDCILQINGEHR